jgi:hypothetical protein
LLAAIAVLIRWLAELLVARISPFPELLVTATLTWAVLFAAPLEIRVLESQRLPALILATGTLH